MKTFYTLILTCLAFGLINTPVSAQCNYTTGSNGTSAFLISPITINGSMTDWSFYLNDPDNNSYDNTNGTDLDAPISDAGRDLTRMAFTSDLSNLYIYIERAGSTNNSVDIIYYVDINNNDLMNLNEPVLHFNWSGANGNVTVSVANYIPAADALSNTISQNLDGGSLWGTLTPRTNLGQLGKGSADGRSMEVMIPLSNLTQLDLSGNVINQLQPGQDFKFHLSTINGNISSIPNLNSINDNFGGCLNAPVATSTLPVSLLSFQANLKEKDALLSWTTTNHYNFSHFVIEKSVDARNYKEAAIVFAPETTSSENNYKYKDNLQNSTDKAIYYRLKMVDVDGKSSYSQTRMLRLTEEHKVQISTFPNPATSEVRVMIPNSWQEKMVTYEIYNSTGTMVQRYQNKQAAQIQQLNVQQLSTGSYILKVNNGTNTSVSTFIKQ